MSSVGPLLPIQHVCGEVGSLSKTGPHVLVASFSHFDPNATWAMQSKYSDGADRGVRGAGQQGEAQNSIHWK
jgi:hypothetical protein